MKFLIPKDNLQLRLSTQVLYKLLSYYTSKLNSHAYFYQKEGNYDGEITDRGDFICFTASLKVYYLFKNNMGSAA